MITTPFSVSTAIPFVNADPHVGFVYEALLADVLARHARLRGRSVRFVSGADENSLKDVPAAEAAGVDVARFVEAHTQKFAALQGSFDLSYDDFVRTSADARHRRIVERVFRACAQDLERRSYEGLYCVGCEAFYEEADLAAG